MVTAPAKTGKENSSKKAVTITDQANNGMRCMYNPRARMLKIVTIKLIAPAKEDAPATCTLNIDSSTELVACAMGPLSGGYRVQPVPVPPSTMLDNTVKKNAGTNNQKLMLFKRGKAMSGAPINNGTNQFPNPPNISGITVKKIITKAWAVITTL